MIEKPMSGLFLLIPGALLVLGGVLVLLEPRVLVWLMGPSASVRELPAQDRCSLRGGTPLGTAFARAGSTDRAAGRECDDSARS
jgi:hypothetical protein